jgi:peptide-methionine (S)-S-oxide reductase
VVRAAAPENDGAFTDRGRTDMTDATPSPAPEEATLAGGCFWCLEAVYEQVEGVLSVESGYSNGQAPNPTYEQVCSGRTGHAEVVRLRFDPSRIGYRDILEIFFTIHDPTTLNRQGNDVGTQYRSGIYFHDAQQEQVAREVIGMAQEATGGRVVTELLPVANYHRAEDEHQHYFALHPNQGYCAFVVAPKVEKFRRTFAERIRRGA